MENLNLDGINLGEVFKNMKPSDEILVSVEIARRDSVQVETIERKTIAQHVEIDKLRKSVVKFIIAGVAVLSLINLSWDAIDKYNSTIKMSDLSKEIGSIVSQVGDLGPQSIVTQNTHAIENGFRYDQEAIAKDLLSLDSSIFDYAFCTVCSEMGTSMNNKVGLQGMSNIETVIYYLKMYSKEEKYFNQYVSNMFYNVNNLNDYLLKNGFVDGGGNPSLDAFRDYCNKNAESVQEIVQTELGNKGATL